MLESTALDKSSAECLSYRCRFIRIAIAFKKLQKFFFLEVLVEDCGNLVSVDILEVDGLACVSVFFDYRGEEHFEDIEE